MNAEDQERAGAGAYRVLGQLEEFGFYFKFHENSLEDFEEGGQRQKQGPARKLYLAQAGRGGLFVLVRGGGMVKSCQLQTVF